MDGVGVVNGGMAGYFEDGCGRAVLCPLPAIIQQAARQQLKKSPQ